jgi:hypothetical protein
MENMLGGACGTHGREEKHVQGFGGKAQGNRLLVRPRRRWEDGITMEFRDVGR